jgi:uncharacterized protein (DUF1697 family)
MATINCPVCGGKTEANDLAEAESCPHCGAFCIVPDDTKQSEAVCVFLRGINVGSIRVRMEDLRNAFVDMGFVRVTTVLNTGNVIAVSPDDAITREQLIGTIEAGLTSRFGYDAHVATRNMSELEMICQAAETIAVPEGCHLYFLLCDDKNAMAELASRFEAAKHEEGEQWIPGPQGAFWTVPKGKTLQPKFGIRVLGNARYKSVLTSRNMNTINLLFKQMNEKYL